MMIDQAKVDILKQALEIVQAEYVEFFTLAKSLTSSNLNEVTFHVVVDNRICHKHLQSLIELYSKEETE